MLRSNSHLGVGRGCGVGCGLGVTLGVAVGETGGVIVGVGGIVSDGVGVGLGGIVAVGVAVGVGVSGGGGVGVQDGPPWHQVTSTVSTRQPSPEPLLSLAILQRNSPPGMYEGSSTTVVMKPPELPLHARRPAIGLPRSVLIVRL
jgi:hypothetical protein